MKEKCENCRYFHPLQHNFKVNIGYESSYACDIWLHDGSRKGWIQEVRKDDMCEMFTEREK